MAAHPLAPVRGSDRLVVATSQTCATKPRRPPPCRSRPRASAAPLSVVRPFALASNESSDTCVLPFASQINHALSTPAHNRPFEAEVIFCVQGAVSPLLSNLMLDVLDKELEKRGHRFVRYADDCNIYVRSQKAGERVMAGIERFLEKRLKLKVNKAKSAVAKPSVRKFLSFSFTGGREPRRRIAPQAIARFKARVRELTRRTRGRSLAQIVKELSVYLIGWRGYFGFCQTPSVLRALDEWLRRRLRAIAWKQWKRGSTRVAELRRRGVGRDLAAQTAGSPHGPWRLGNSPALNIAMPNRYLGSLGLASVAVPRPA
ncbi:MAG TPA: group II intron maturase-specific domain-containing protein [Bradyrhizobium sp.]|uniref:group II intron maturase-specific domain-containing protein n=1 Tax=Bradyrhizobium sp. TaxID=376 RepID=UPI002C512422|nr:group II intron maturase-specific domain-containing protein [Bradyrhizobium sp.]HLZ03774.1 group II intron maturase-specific domain-containing protein [Bradyrhizobium sp.]